mgnify:CR=1 FL=1
MNCQPLAHRTALLTLRRALPLAMAVAFALSLSACGGAQKAQTTATATATVNPLPATAVCPVMKKTFKPTAATETVVVKGKTYYMCCAGCAAKLKANPDKYLSSAAAPAKPCDGGCDKKDGAAAKPCADCEKGTKPAAAGTPAATTTGAAMPATAVCPVSGKTFKPTAETAKATHNGKTYYLCCDGCVKKFAADPAKYAK